MSDSLDGLIRQHWWAAVATLCRLTGDLGTAEDAVQDACVAALERWPAAGVPANARGWLIGVARHKAVDRLRREAVRGAKEAASMRELSTAQIAAAFLVSEETMAKRLVRAKAKIREAQIPFRVPGQEDLPARLGAVLRVIYVLFTEGHMASHGEALVRGELCDTAISLARGLSGPLPGEPEAMGLLALLLLTDARRAARSDDVGDLVLLADQDRGRYEPTPVVEANRAVAVAMAEGPAAGLVILDALAHHPQLRRWPQLYIAQADLLIRLGRAGEADAAYRAALDLEPASATRSFIAKRLRELTDPGTRRAARACPAVRER